MAGRAVSRRAEAISQAIALQPDGIVLGTIDADEQAVVIGAAAAKGVVVVDWPCSSRPTSGSTAGRKDLDSGSPEAYKNLWSVQ
jgi:ribose transport system substrate-binding protein